MYFLGTYKSGSRSLYQHDDFEYPLLKQLLLTDTQNSTYIKISYSQVPFLQGGGVLIDFNSCLIGDNASGNDLPLFTLDAVGQGFTLYANKNLRIKDLQDEQTFLVSSLHEKVQKNLIGLKTQTQGTQTANFDLNEIGRA